MRQFSRGNPSPRCARLIERTRAGEDGFVDTALNNLDKWQPAGVRA